MLPKQTHSMQTRDRVRLDADVYYPDAVGPFPVLLMRQPYGRAIASTIVYAHPIWYAAHGYIVVIQDVRGRGTSEGEFWLFEDEIEDGYDTVNWAAALPQSSGVVGMYGFSYQGMTQLYAAVKRPVALKALCPAMLGYDLYHDWAYEGGAFCLQANLGWAIQVAAETARLKADEATFLALSDAARNLPLHDPVPARPAIMSELAADSFYHDWLDRPPSDPYWQRLSPKTYVEAFDLPMLHIGGWFDPFMRGTLNLYNATAARSQHPQHLLVGAWAHLPWGRKVGSVDYGSEAASLCDRAQIRWFDQFLKGIDTELLNEPSVKLFELGSNQWRSFDRFPTDAKTPYYLTSTGLAGLTDADGSLTSTPGDYSAFDQLVHDPWRPVPALGGHASAPSGSFDRASLDCRSDVLTYTSAPFDDGLQVIGQAIVTLYCSADMPSFDLSAVLSEVRPNGGVYNVTQGYRRVNSSEVTEPLQIVLQPICIQIAKGSAIRLSLSAACFPAYPVNGGTGATPGEAKAIAAQIITLTLQTEDSCVLLPIST
ncbi:CocE/NonD family hydrolase [Phormidesmis priestleyi]|uniref:CocE/NonD family hydrolase n=1 Tax=Phormidesmis priestleyi TaxID=268141 RepID=UPI00294FF4E5|nr:CocE/NonD family hydrolase [Phormidesmis priestleyi]